MIRALGAQPVELPYGQVETGLATGLVDGAENNWPSFVTTGHFKYARNYTLTEHTMSPEVLIMSLRAWQSLADADKAIFREAHAKRLKDVYGLVVEPVTFDAPEPDPKSALTYSISSVSRTR